MHKTTLIFIVMIILIGAGLFLTRDESEKTVELPDFDHAPSFSLPDYEGETVESMDFAGKVQVVNSWASWCTFCIKELPDLAEIQTEFGEEIAVIAVNRREQLSIAKGFTDSLDVTNGMIYLLDPTDSFYKSIGGFTMPETIFVNSEGDITFHKRGVMTLADIRQKTQEAIDSVPKILE